MRIEQQKEAISYAAYSAMRNIYEGSPGQGATFFRINLQMQQLGYDPDVTTEDYLNDGAAALGNYVGSLIADFRTIDNALQDENFIPDWYDPQNNPFLPGSKCESEYVNGEFLAAYKLRLCSLMPQDHRFMRLRSMKVRTGVT